MAEIGRNDPCPCGSGLKYKKCCWNKKRGFLQSASIAPHITSYHKRSQTVITFFLIVLLSVAAYYNSFQVPFVFDDGAHIVNNRAIQLDNLAPHRVERFKKGLTKGRALATFTFGVNYYLGQLDPFGYHLFNLIIHILTAFGIYLFILITLTIPLPRDSLDPEGGGYEKIAYQVALGASLIFAVHPVNTQAVTYIVQRMTSMCALFYILSMLAYIKGRQTNGPPRLIWFAAGLLSAVLALSSKQNALTLPVFIVLYEIYFFQKLDWDWIRKKWVLLAGLSLGIAAFILLMALIYTNFTLFHHMVDGYRTRPFNMWERLLTQFRVVTYYFSLLLYPNPSRLNLDYEFTISRSILSPPTTLVCIVFILALIWLGFRLMKRRPVISFCILWFFGNLVIESSIYPLDLVYEHRLYLPSLGFLCIVVIFAVIGIERLAKTKGSQTVLKIVSLGLVLSVFTFWTHKRNIVWHSVISILEDVVSKSPHNSRQHVNLGVAYSSARQLDKAIEQYKEGIRLDPNYPETYNNLGNAYNRKGMLDEAIAQYKKAIQMRFKYKEAHNNMGSAFYKKGMFDEAIKEHKIALSIQGDCEKSLNNLGVAYSGKKMYPEAIAAFKKAIDSKPGFAKPYINLGLTYTLKRNSKEAMKMFEKARLLEPNNPGLFYNLGNAYSDLGKHEKAVEAFRRATRLNPKYDVAYNNMGLAYRQIGKEKEAIAAYQAALKINPRRAEFHYNLGLVYAGQSKHKEALEAFRKAVELAPRLARARFDLAKTLEATGDYQPAANEYEQAIRLGYNSAEIYQKLGMLYADKIRDIKKARFYLQRAVRMTPGPKTKKALEKKLSELK